MMVPKRLEAQLAVAGASTDEQQSPSSPCEKLRLVSGLEDEFLDSPVQKFGDVEFVRGGAGDLVNPAELAELFARFAENAENFSVERKFVDAAGEGVGSVENLIRSGRDANGPGRAGRHGASG